MRPMHVLRGEKDRHDALDHFDFGHDAGLNPCLHVLRYFGCCRFVCVDYSTICPPHRRRRGKLEHFSGEVVLPPFPTDGEGWNEEFSHSALGKGTEGLHSHKVR